MSSKRFARSKNKEIFGVCAGLAEYIGVNITLMRVLWVLVAVFTEFGLALLAYVILAFAMSAPEGAPESQRFWHGMDTKRMFFWFSAALIAIGIYLIVTSIIPINLHQYLFPIGLILCGGLLLAWSFRGQKE
jgi:phage shock protein PspC (stress-responsive transcriptional regulator)